jgi:alanine-glyoxylate transaminase/serine-glyoxylate transaminase/serine-pyruvate transaminase
MLLTRLARKSIKHIKPQISFHIYQAKMSSSLKDRKEPLLMIPGPIEFDEQVLRSMSTVGTSHMDAGFQNEFGEALEGLRRVLLTKDGQPFIIAGSGTMGWDIAAANCVEPGEKVLVLNTGLFGDRFGECLEVYGAKVTHLKAPFGDRPSDEEIEKALKADKYKMITITHVDTSSGVLNDPEAVAKVVKRVSPETLICVDGVCSIAAETLRMDDWGVDLALTASQKALGTPPGLCVVVASQRAIVRIPSCLLTRWLEGV